MNLDETQRVNLLVKTLQTQGIATSSLEAFDKASKMIKIAESKDHEGDNLQLLEQKCRHLLEQNNSKVFNDISKVKDSVNSLISEINLLKKQIKEREEVKSQEIIKEIRKEPEKIEVSEKAVQRETDVKKASHPKRGNYNSEDVSVEKFFYFGKK